MTGVAGALVAQIASSSLQLEYMKTIHPIVPALCTSSLVIALLCVYYSFRMHYLFAKCTCVKDLITAFTQRAPVGTEGGSEEGGPGGGEIEPGGGEEEPGSEEGEPGSGDGGSGSEEAREECVVRDGEEEVNQERGGGDEGGEEAGARDRRLEEGIPGPIEEGGERRVADGGEKRLSEGGGRLLASYKAILILWLPLYLLKLALLLYLVNIYLYWLVASLMDLEGRREESSNVGFHALKLLVSRADNKSLGLSYSLVGNDGGWISMACGLFGNSRLAVPTAGQFVCPGGEPWWMTLWFSVGPSRNPALQLTPKD